MTQDRPPTDTISDLIREAAVAAIMPRFTPANRLTPGALASTNKSDGSPVTIADHEAEAIITKALNVLDPGVTVIGEECDAVNGMSIHGVQQMAEKLNTYWTIDPLDGTRSFLRGSPDFAVMVSETVGHILRRSWIYLPVTRDMFVAHLNYPFGGVAQWNGNYMLPGLAPHRAVRGVSYTPPGSPNHSGFLCGRGSGSVGVDYTHLARGLVDFVAHREPKPWDHFPGSLLTRVLGGVSRYNTGEAYKPTVHPSGKLLSATDNDCWAYAAQHLYTPTAAYGLSALPPCGCRIGTGVSLPDCKLHG